mgnify:CR=1 FL=1
MSLLTSNYLTPHGREEEWRFTPLKRLAGLHDLSVDIADHISISSKAALAAGVSLTTPDSAEFPPGYASNDVVTNRIRQNVKKISLLSIDKDIELSEPIFLKRSCGNTAELSRLVIQAGVNSRATVIIENNGSAQIGEEIEISLAAGASLNFITLQEWDRNAVHVGQHHAIIAKDAQFTSYVVSIGGSVVRISPTVEFTGPGAFADLYGISLIGHFLTASIISVPAAIMYANIMMPSDQKTEDQNQIKESSLYKSTLDALTRGTQDGLNITLSIAALLLVLISLVTLVNFALTGLPLIGGEFISLERVAGWIFSPIAWCMGIPWSEAQLGGSLLGVKTILNEFVAYVNLAGIDASDLSEKSRLIMLYALCGFANLSSVGILLSGISAMVPERKDDLISVSGKALVGATLASCFTGLVVGIIS